eukprot:Stramenopile-MAST_4_protein_1796
MVYSTNCTGPPVSACQEVCPLFTTYRSTVKVINDTQGCPTYRYFNSVAEVNVYDNKVCCCTLWCASKHAIDFSSFWIMGILVVLIIASLFLSLYIFAKVRHKLKNIPFLLGRFLYSPPLVAKYRCPYSCRDKWGEFGECTHPWFFTLEALHHHCDVVHNIQDREAITEQRSHQLVEPKIIRGPEEEMFQYSGLIVTLLVYVVLLSPLLFTFLLFVTVKSRLKDAYCLEVDGRGDADAWIVSVALFAALIGTIFLLFAVNRWKVRNWSIDGLTSFCFAASLLLFMAPLIAYVPLYDHVHYRSDYAYVSTVFLTLNILPTIAVIFASVGQDLPLDVASFVKRYKEKQVEGDNMYCITVCGASNEAANGVYVETPCGVVERNVPLHVVRPADPSLPALASMHDTKLKNLPVLLHWGEKGGVAPIAGVIVKINRSDHEELSFNIRLRLDFSTIPNGKFSLSSDPSKYPTYAKVNWKTPKGFTHVLSRHSFPAGPGQPSVPHWYLSEGISDDMYHSKTTRYIARADPVNSPFPPSTGWHPVDNGSPEGTDTRPPSLIVEDVTIFEAEYQAKVKAEKQARKQRAMKWLMYIFAYSMLGLFAWYTYQSPCVASKTESDKYVGVFHLAVIIMIEIAVAWHYVAGLDTSALTVAYLHMIARICMIFGGSQYYYVAGSCIYFVFAMLLVYHIVSKRWPVLTSRQIIRRNLSSVLPAWLYSGGGGGSSGGQGSVIDGELLEELLLSPLLKVAGVLDWFISKIIFCCPGRISAKAVVEATVTNPSGVLFYLTLIFFVVGDVLESHFPSLVTVKIPRTSVEFHQNEIGNIAIASVFMIYFIADFLRCYDYYGHRKDRLPNKFVAIRAIGMTVYQWGVGVVYYFYGTPAGSEIIAVVSFASPLMIFISAWTFRNWAANDYVFLIELNLTGLKPMSFDDKLRSVGKDALKVFDATQWWPKFKLFVLDWYGKIRNSFFTMVGMGAFVSLSILVSVVIAFIDESVNPAIPKVGVALFQILVCTYLTIKKWFNTFRFPTVELAANFVWIAYMCTALLENKVMRPWQITVVVVAIPIAQILIMSFYQLYVDEFEIVWKKGPNLLLSFGCWKKSRKWSNVIACIALCEVGILLFLVIMPNIFPAFWLLDVPGVQFRLVYVLGIAYIVQLATLWILFTWVSNHFVFPPLLKWILMGIMASLLIAVVILNFLSPIFTANDIVDVACAVSMVACFVGYKQAAASATIFYSDQVFPAFSLDPRTNNLVDRSDEIKYGLYLANIACVWGLYQAILGNSLNGTTRQTRGFYLVCATIVVFFAVTASLRRQTKMKFWSAWSRLKHYPDIIDHIRVQSLKAETSSQMGTRIGKKGELRDVESELAMKSIVSLTARSSRKERKIFHTHEDCIKAAGAVPSTMPSLLAFIDKTFTEGFSEIADTRKAFQDSVSTVVMQQQVTQAFKSNLKAGQAAQKFKSTFAAGQSRVGHMKNASASIFASAKGTLAGLAKETQDGLLSSSHKLEGANPFKDQLSDIKFLIAGEEDDEEDLPELVVSGCGLKAVEGLYCATTDKSTSLRYVRIGDGAQYEMHLRSNGQVPHWTIEYDGNQLYAVRADLGAYEGVKLEEGKAFDETYPPKTGWSIVVSAEKSEDGNAPPPVPGPPPIVTNTTLDNWGEVLRASKGILEFDETMDRVLEEERRIEARFKHLVIESAAQQAVHEETLLWSFVGGCMPKLIDQRGETAGGSVSRNVLNSMSAHELRLWSKRKKKKLTEFGRSYANRALREYEKSQEAARQERQGNADRKNALGGANYVVNFGEDVEHKIMERLTENILEFARRFNTSQDHMKKLRECKVQIQHMRTKLRQGESPALISNAHALYSSVIDTIRNIAADSNREDELDDEYVNILFRLASEYVKKTGKTEIGSSSWKKARTSQAGGLRWSKPPNLLYHWLDAGFFDDKQQDQTLRGSWEALKEQGFDIGDLEVDIIARGNYRYFKTLPDRSTAKNRLVRQKTLQHFKKEFNQKWYTNDEFVRRVHTILPLDEWGWRLVDVHKQLAKDYDESNDGTFDPRCSVDRDDVSFFKVQLKYFESTLNASLEPWGALVKACAGDEHQRVDDSDSWHLFWGDGEADDCADPADINQGDANDCWLLSAMMISAARDNENKSSSIIKNLFSHYSQNPDPSAVDSSLDLHVVRFYRPDIGKWEHVVIDSAVPVREPAKGVLPGQLRPKYACSREPETWVMLLEKAYTKWTSSRAKASGNPNPYENINFGLIDEALVSFTGGVKSLIALDTAEGQADARSGELWNKIVDFHRKGYLLGASTPSGHDAFWDTHGLVKGHAYGILSIKTTSPPAGTTSGSRMIKLRNPWGVNPWDFDPPANPSEDQPWPIQPLDWSPHSPMWQGSGAQYMKRKLQASENVDPGAFWITYEDFVRCYSAIFCCRILDGWTSFSKSTAWVEGCMGGVISGPSGFENPQWFLKVSKQTAAYFTLSQTISSSFKFIMLAVVPGGKKIDRPVGADLVKHPSFFYSGAPDDSREIGFDVPILPAGEYTIIASTFAPGQSTGCRLEIYFKEPGAVSNPTKDFVSF